jgi:hypothetical protein
MRANSETLPAASPHTLAAGGTRARRGSRRHAARQYGPWAAHAQYHTSATTQRCVASRQRQGHLPRPVLWRPRRCVGTFEYWGALSRATHLTTTATTMRRVAPAVRQVPLQGILASPLPQLQPGSGSKGGALSAGLAYTRRRAPSGSSSSKVRLPSWDRRPRL